MTWAPEEILLFRKSLGLTQEEMARYLGVNRNSVSRWESGSIPINESHINQLNEMKREFSVVDIQEFRKNMKSTRKMFGTNKIFNASKLDIDVNRWRCDKIVMIIKEILMEIVNQEKLDKSNNKWVNMSKKIKDLEKLYEARSGIKR